VIFNAQDIGAVGDRVVHTDASMGIEPAFLSVSPKKDSLASKFQTSSTAVAFFIEAPTGSVVDVELTFKSDAQGNAVAFAAASVAGTIGAVVYRGLDGLAKAASKFTIPTSLNST